MSRPLRRPVENAFPFCCSTNSCSVFTRQHEGQDNENVYCRSSKSEVYIFHPSFLKAISFPEDQLLCVRQGPALKANLAQWAAEQARREASKSS